MDPLTMMLIGAGIKATGELASARGKRKRTAFDDRMATQIQDLQRLEELNALGLTPEEMATMRAEGQRATAASQRAGEARAGLALAGAGAGSGEQLSRAIAEEAKLQEQQQRIAEQLSVADLQRQSDQEDELNALIFQQAQREMDRRAARSEAIKNIGDIGLETAGLMTKIGTGGTGFTAAEISAAAEKFGVDEEKAKQYLEFQADNPEFFEALNA